MLVYAETPAFCKIVIVGSQHRHLLEAVPARASIFIRSAACCADRK
jgi:hypothetical protein